MSEFKIHFIELCFLAEVSIPPVPIARGCFWDKLINDHYFYMSDREINELFNLIIKNTRFDANNEDCKWFYDRFNPDNQYAVKTLYKGTKTVNYCFFHNGRYHVSKTKSVDEKYIIDVCKKLNN